MSSLARIFCALLAVGSLATTRAHAQAQDHDVRRLKWLAGCWELRMGDRVVHEQWMAPLGGLMLGMARTVVRDSLREHEQVRIESRGGRTTYVAKPSGQAEATFEARLLSDTLVVFENAQHDFPQRIVYRRIGSDSLRAAVEGTMGGRERSIPYPYRRIACS